MNNIKHLLIISIALVLLQSCSTPSGDSEEPTKEAAVSAISETVFLPGLEAFTEKSSSFTTQVASFIEDPTQESLDSTQEAWASLQAAWQQTASYQFGPIEDERILNKINFWPKDTDLIDDKLEDAESLTLDDIILTGSFFKGLPVIEYLLFDHENGDTEILAQFQIDEGRRNYLDLLAQELQLNAEDVENAWQPDDGNYFGTINNLSSGLNLIVNQMVFTIEEIRNTKIGKPLGKDSGGEPDPTSVESQQSEISLTNIRNNVVSLYNTFNGINGNINDTGIDDYLRYYGYYELRDDINDQFSYIFELIDNINHPLWEAVNSETEEVETLYSSFTTLLRLIKVDMATATNETVHFNDSDGD